MLRRTAPWLLLLALLLPGRAKAQPTEEVSEGEAAADESGEGAETETEAEEEEETFGDDLAIEDPSGEALRPLLEGLRRAQVDSDHQARILMYGASHVAADFFANVLRERLQERFGDAGHGFIMPAQPWRSYRHLGGVSVESPRNRWDAHRVRATTRDIEPLGVAGLAVSAERAGTWGRIDTGGAPAGRFVVFYLEQPDGGGIDLILDGHRAARISTAAEEIGPGVYELNTEEGHHVLELRVRGNGPVRLFGVSVEREQPGVIVDNMGINGARAVSQLYWDEAIHAHYLRRLAPDLVVLAYGTNESGDDGHPIEDYEVELRRVVARVRGSVPEAGCLLIGPSDRPMRDEEGELIDRPRTHEVVEVQRRVSRDFGCGFFDLVGFGGGPLSTVRWAEADPPYTQRDYVHYTVRGYLRLGEVLHAALLEGYEDHLEQTH